MDPNATLREIRKLVEEIQRRTLDEEECNVSDDFVRLAELTQALDEWICKGGFLPNEWRSS